MSARTTTGHIAPHNPPALNLITRFGLDKANALVTLVARAPFILLKQNFSFIFAKGDKQWAGIGASSRLNYQLAHAKMFV